MFIFTLLSSYFLSAFSVILDKFLLGSKRISSAPVYSFYIGMLGLFTLVFIPFIDFEIPGLLQIVLSLVSGIFFSLGILALYFAIQKSEASRVSPIVGAVIPVVSYLISLFSGTENFSLLQSLGIAILIFGGLLISFDLPLKLNKKKFFSGFYPSVISGLLLATAYFIFKFVYAEQSFLNGFVWTRIGSFFATLGYFLIPGWRKEIVSSFKEFKKPKKQGYQTGGIFVANKIIGGISSILFNYALALGSVTLANSLVSFQYIFILILAYFGHLKFPLIFEERLYFWDWAQKISAIIVIGLGVFLIYR